VADRFFPSRICTVILLSETKIECENLDAAEIYLICSVYDCLPVLHSICIKMHKIMGSCAKTRSDILGHMCSEFQTKDKFHFIHLVFCGANSIVVSICSVHLVRTAGTILKLSWSTTCHRAVPQVKCVTW
jgi:hypothetical protein